MIEARDRDLQPPVDPPEDDVGYDVVPSVFCGDCNDTGIAYDGEACTCLEGTRQKGVMKDV